MHIALNAALASPRATGIGVYARALATMLPDVDGGRHTYDIFIGERQPESLLNARIGWHEVQTTGAARRLAFDCWQVGRNGHTSRADVFHSTSAYLPWNLSCPAVLTVHDLAIYHYPEAFRWLNRSVGRRLFEAAVRQAHALIAVSASTRRDLIEVLDVPEERIHVIPEAADALFRPASPAEVARVREQYNLAPTQPYIVSVATAEPRKNLLRLLAAFERVRAQLAEPPVLVLVGAPGWLSTPLEARLLPLQNAGCVRVTGYVPRADLPALYTGAAAVAYPSLFEGFGLPVLEAMACGAAVLTSTTSSLPEVAGDAALAVDPTATEALAQGLYHLLSDAALANALRQRGPQRAALFSWEQTARRTVMVYESVAVASHVGRARSLPAPSLSR